VLKRALVSQGTLGQGTSAADADAAVTSAGKTEAAHDGAINTARYDNCLHIYITRRKVTKRRMYTCMYRPTIPPAYKDVEVDQGEINSRAITRSPDNIQQGAHPETEETNVREGVSRFGEVRAEAPVTRTPNRVVPGAGAVSQLIAKLGQSVDRSDPSVQEGYKELKRLVKYADDGFWMQNCAQVGGRLG